ncbi:DUF6090 family protein [Flavobacteriaceae bacterium KMM 6897]|nr:DUF6090 family protein [Flavobacteriaceae bacterium KMM 6897]
MEKNKTGKYLKYAIGEIILVVIGILIALSLNNWNENQKLNKTRNQLIQDLKVELISAQERIEPVIKQTDAQVEKSKLYFTHLESKENFVPSDSLRSWLTYILSGAPYDLELPTYEEAKSSGRISLLNNKEILLGYSNLLVAAQGHQLHRKIGAEMWYLGSTWEMRSEIGGKRVLTKTDPNLPEKLILSDHDYREFLTNPSSYAAIENANNMTRTTGQYLNRMNNALKEIVILLEKEVKKK